MGYAWISFMIPITTYQLFTRSILLLLCGTFCIFKSVLGHFTDNVAIVRLPRCQQRKLKNVVKGNKSPETNQDYIFIFYDRLLLDLHISQVAFAVILHDPLVFSAPVIASVSLKYAL